MKARKLQPNPQVVYFNHELLRTNWHSICIPCAEFSDNGQFNAEFRRPMPLGTPPPDQPFCREFQLDH